jgi:NAD(P)-dependent dehydrogenase (short-subunit alcohol dehydrogenase family)
MARLDNKVAVITGGCSGIGLGTVELFLEEGASVVVGDISDEVGAQLTAKHAGRLRYRRCDVTQPAEIEALMQFAATTFGGIDVVFNNAGAGGSPARIDEITPEEWDATQGLLLRSVAFGIRYATPHLKARGGGSIVNTSSVSALQAGAAPAAYSVAKAAVIHLTKISAAQLAQFNIRVNAVCPGLILTNIFTPAARMDETTAAQTRAYLAQAAPLAQPIKKPGAPRDIAQACLFLASDESAFVTGTNLVVDGGLTVGPRSSWDPAFTGSIVESLGGQLKS